MSQKPQESSTDFNSGSQHGSDLEGENKMKRKTKEQMDEILFQAVEKIYTLSETYAKKYLYSEELEADIRGMYENKKDISIQEVNSMVYSDLKKQISELNEFKEIVADVTLDLTGKQPESREYRFFIGHSKNRVNFFFRHEDSECTGLVFEKIVKQKSNC